MTPQVGRSIPDAYIPTSAKYSDFWKWCKKTDAWNAFTQDGVTPPSLTITSSEQSFMTSYRSDGYVVDYFAKWWIAVVLNAGEIDYDFYDDMDKIRVEIWRNKNTSGAPWKGIDSPSQNSYKLRYQYICFNIWFEQWYWLKVKQAIPSPKPDAFTSNELKALRAFAGALEATQEFVPDSWFSPDTNEDTLAIEEEVEWNPPQTVGRNGDERSAVSRAVRKVLRMLLARR